MMSVGEQAVADAVASVPDFSQLEMFGFYLASIGRFIMMALRWIDGPQPEDDI